MTDQSVMQLTQILYKPGLLIPAVDPTAPPGLKNVALPVSQLPGGTADAPIVELTGNTGLTRAAHDGAVLVCLAPLTLSANFATAGLGFECDIVNLSSGNVVMGSGITVGNGAPVLVPGGEARVRGLPGVAGGVVFWAGVDVASTAPALTVALIGNTTAGTAILVSGAYFNDVPVALDYSTNGGTTWVAAVAPTISAGAFSFGISGGLPAGAYSLLVRDHNALSVVGASNAFTVAGNSLTVSAPGTGVAGTALAVSGSVWPVSDSVQIALATSSLVAPTSGYVAAANSGGMLSGSLTPVAAGTYYVWANDLVTALTAVSGPIAVT